MKRKIISLAVAACFTAPDRMSDVTNVRLNHPPFKRSQFPRQKIDKRTRRGNVK